MKTHLFITDRNEKERIYWNSLPVEKRKEKWLKHKYKMTYEDFTNLLSKQDGICPGCGITLIVFIRHGAKERACIDHCHISNKVRGVLCNHCNRILGFAKDDPKVLQNLIEYLNAT